MYISAAPTNYRVIIRLPIITPPPLVIVAAAITSTGKDEASILAPVKPMVPGTMGTDTTARVPEFLQPQHLALI